MKCKIKKGSELIIESCCKFYEITNYLIINFNNRYTYIDFKQKGNHLLINTTEGEIDIVFTGETPKLKFETFCKNQLILDVLI